MFITSKTQSAVGFASQPFKSSGSLSGGQLGAQMSNCTLNGVKVVKWHCSKWLELKDFSNMFSSKTVQQW